MTSREEAGYKNTGGGGAGGSREERARGNSITNILEEAGCCCLKDTVGLTGQTNWRKEKDKPERPAGLTESGGAR